jgi:hypothetical protein
VTWNELPLLIFGASDANRRFYPFGAALVSSDKSSLCYETLFTSLQSLSIQDLHKLYSPKFIMADGHQVNIYYIRKIRLYGNFLSSKESLQPNENYFQMPSD